MRPIRRVALLLTFVAAPATDAEDVGMRDVASVERLTLSAPCQTSELHTNPLLSLE